MAQPIDGLMQIQLAAGCGAISSYTTHDVYEALIHAWETAIKLPDGVSPESPIFRFKGRPSIATKENEIVLDIQAVVFLDWQPLSNA